MIGVCPYPCYNKNHIGYCQTTMCINPAYQSLALYDKRKPAPKACENCPNHPKNGGSGVCNCVLGVSPIY